MADMCTFVNEARVFKTPLSKNMLRCMVANTCDKCESDLISFQQNCPSLFFEEQCQDPILELVLGQALLPAIQRLNDHTQVVGSISSLQHTARVAQTYLCDLRFLRQVYEDYHVHTRIGYEDFCFELRDHCRASLPRLTGIYLYNDKLRMTYIHAFNEFLLQKRLAPIVC